MFDNAKWIGLEYGENAPWKGKNFENEDCPGMIGQEGYRHLENGSIVFRREFAVRSRIVSARLAICGLGYYDVYINGNRPDEKRVLTPIVSSYFKNVRYDIYDVSKLLCIGENVIAAEVCGGWFTGKAEFWGWQQMFHGNPRLIAELEIKTADGKTERISTDTESWKAAHGAVEYSCIYNGERVDLNRISKDWNKIGFSAEGWNDPVE